jgi:hypothetical protein
LHELDPDVALGSGTLHAKTLLLLWCFRDTALPLLWIGLTVAFVSLQPDRITEQMQGLSGADGLLGGLLSPLALVALSVLVRLSVSVLGLAAAFPLSLSIEPGDYTRGGRLMGRIRLWRDRLHISRAYRSLRWTWAVRERAAERLGRLGTTLVLCDRVLRWSNLALVVVFLVTVVVVASQPGGIGGG